MFTILAFIYGASLGSFANLVADRLRVKTVLKGRSQCLHCSHKLTWKELVPIVSFLYQKGRCKKCKTKLSYSYLWSEVLSGLLISILPTVIANQVDVFTSPSALIYGVFLFFIFSISIALCMAIVIYDLRHMLVPLELALVLLIIGMVATLARQYFYHFNIFDFFSGVIVAFPYLLMYLISKGKWVGMGDVFMYAALGFLIGLPMGASMFFYSVWIGSLVALMLMILHKKDYNLKSEIPFTPFIVIGFLLALYSHADILSITGLL